MGKRREYKSEKHECEKYEHEKHRHGKPGYNVHRKISTGKLTMTGVMAAVICILGPLSVPVPVSPVPVSLTSLAVALTVWILGWKYGTVSYLIYLLLGFAGLPVFSGFSGGLTKLAGPTGGYLIGFIFMAIISGWLIEKYNGKLVMSVLGILLGTGVMYLFGTVWLAQMLGRSFAEALMIGVVPFLPGDAVKTVIVFVAGPKLKKGIVRAGIYR